MANSDGEVEKFEGEKSWCENQKEAAICLHEPLKKYGGDVLARVEQK